GQLRQLVGDVGLRCHRLWLCGRLRHLLLNVPLPSCGIPRQRLPPGLLVVHRVEAPRIAYVLGPPPRVAMAVGPELLGEPVLVEITAVWPVRVIENVGPAACV